MEKWAKIFGEVLIRMAIIGAIPLIIYGISQTSWVMPVEVKAMLPIITMLLIMVWAIKEKEDERKKESARSAEKDSKAGHKAEEP